MSIEKSSCNGILLLLIILLQCTLVSLRPKCTFLPSMGTESQRSLLFLMLKILYMIAHNGSFHLQEHTGRCEGVTLRRVQTALLPGSACTILDADVILTVATDAGKKKSKTSTQHR